MWHEILVDSLKIFMNPLISSACLKLEVSGGFVSRVKDESARGLCFTAWSRLPYSRAFPNVQLSREWPVGAESRGWVGRLC